MMNKLPFIIPFIFFLINCDSNSTSTLTGTWITDRCEATCISDNPQTSVCSFTIGSETLWAKSIYEFTADDSLLSSDKFYSDSDCVTNIIINSAPPRTGTINYQEKQSLTLSSGTPARALFLDINLEGEIFSVQTFFTISNGSLCFTDSLILQARSITFNTADSSADNINFENCLIKFSNR